MLRGSLGARRRDRAQGEQAREWQERGSGHRHHEQVLDDACARHQMAALWQVGPGAPGHVCAIILQSSSEISRSPHPGIYEYTASSRRTHSGPTPKEAAGLRLTWLGASLVSLMAVVCT